MNIQIELISVSELADESFNIVIDGLKPRETYRVEMYLSDYYCINAPMLLAHDVLWNQQRLLYQMRMVLLICHKLHLVLVLMKAFQQWDYFLMQSP